MEISRIIKNLEDYNQISSDNELDLIIRDLSNFSFEDFIYIDYVGNGQNLEMQELFEKLIDKIDAKINQDSIEKKVAIVKSLISIFQKGLNEFNFVYFFIFLYANSRITFNIGDLVDKFALNKEFNEIIIKIFEILHCIKIQVDDDGLSRYFDKLNVLNEEKTLVASLNQVDFAKYNPLLKNNKFFIPNHFYQMIEVLYEYNLELFEKLLTLDNAFTLVLIIKCMSFKQICSFFINHHEIKEETLICFLMKLLRTPSKDRINYYDIIVNMCIQLHQLNKTLFKELMHNLRHNEFFNEVMGLMLCELSEEDINILIESIPLDDNIRQIDIRTKMLDKCRDSEKFNYIIELVYNKWDNHLLNSFNEKERVLNILCTDFCNFIVSYYYRKYDDEKLLDSMKDLFIKIKNLDSDWSYNIIHHRNKFFVYYTKLFIFSVIYRFNELEDDDVKKLYNEFYETYVLFKKFLDPRTENFFDRFEGNLMGDL